MSKILTDSQAFFTVKVMKDYGEAFAKQLAKAYEVGDFYQRERLLKAFAPLFTVYYDKVPLYYKTVKYEELCSVMKEKYKNLKDWKFINSIPFEKC